MTQTEKPYQSKFIAYVKGKAPENDNNFLDEPVYDAVAAFVEASFSAVGKLADSKSVSKAMGIPAIAMSLPQDFYEAKNNLQLANPLTGSMAMTATDIGVTSVFGPAALPVLAVSNQASHYLDYLEKILAGDEQHKPLFDLQTQDPFEQMLIEHYYEAMALAKGLSLPSEWLQVTKKGAAYMADDLLHYAGEAIDEAVDWTQQKTQQLGEAISDGFDKTKVFIKETSEAAVNNALQQCQLFNQTINASIQRFKALWDKQPEPKKQQAQPNLDSVLLKQAGLGLHIDILRAQGISKEATHVYAQTFKQRFMQQFSLNDKQQLMIKPEAAELKLNIVQVANGKQYFNQLRQELNHMLEQQPELKTTVQNLSTATLPRVKLLNTIIQKIPLENCSVEIKQQVSNLEKKLSVLMVTAATQAEQQSSIKEQLTAIQQELKDLGQQQAFLQAGFQVFGEQLTGLNTSFTTYLAHKANKAQIKHKEQELQVALYGMKVTAEGLAFIVGDLGGNQRASQIIGTVGQAAISIFEAGSKIQSIGTALTNIGAAAGAKATFAAIGAGLGPYFMIGMAAYSLISLFGKKQKDDGLGKALQAIMEGISQLSQQVHTLRKEMHHRFDRVEQMLGKFYSDVMQQFASLHETLAKHQGEILETLGGIQRNLTEQHSEIMSALEAIAARQHYNQQELLDKLSQHFIDDLNIEFQGIHNFGRLTKNISQDSYEDIFTKLYTYCINGAALKSYTTVKLHHSEQIAHNLGKLQPLHPNPPALDLYESSFVINSLREEIIKLNIKLNNTYHLLPKEILTACKEPLVNPAIWYLSSKRLMEFIQLYQARHIDAYLIPEKLQALEDIVAAGKRVQQFIQLIRHPALLEQLISNYQQSLIACMEQFQLESLQFEQEHLVKESYKRLRKEILEPQIEAIDKLVPLTEDFRKLHPEKFSETLFFFNEYPMRDRYNYDRYVKELLYGMEGEAYIKEFKNRNTVWKQEAIDLRSQGKVINPLNKPHCLVVFPAGNNPMPLIFSVPTDIVITEDYILAAERLGAGYIKYEYHFINNNIVFRALFMPWDKTQAISVKTLKGVPSCAAWHGFNYTYHAKARKTINDIVAKYLASQQKELIKHLDSKTITGKLSAQLKELNAHHAMLNTYLTLAYSGNVSEKLHFYLKGLLLPQVSEEIKHCFNADKQTPESLAQQFFQTVRGNVLVTPGENAEQSLFAVYCTTNHLQLEAYNAITNQWQMLPAFTINQQQGKESYTFNHIFFVQLSNRLILVGATPISVEILCYDIAEQQWQHLNPLLELNKGEQIVGEQVLIPLKGCVIKNILYIALNVNHAVKIYSYDVFNGSLEMLHEQVMDYMTQKSLLIHPVTNTEKNSFTNHQPMPMIRPFATYPREVNSSCYMKILYGRFDYQNNGDKYSVKSFGYNFIEHQSDSCPIEKIVYRNTARVIFFQQGAGQKLLLFSHQLIKIKCIIYDPRNGKDILPENLDLKYYFDNQKSFVVANAPKNYPHLNQWTDKKYCTTLQLIKIPKNTQYDIIFLVCLGSTGVHSYRYDAPDNTWTTLPVLAAFNNSEWQEEKYYQTFKAQAIFRNGKQQFNVTGFGSEGLLSYVFDAETNQWQALATNKNFIPQPQPALQVNFLIDKLAATCGMFELLKHQLPALSSENESVSQPGIDAMVEQLESFISEQRQRAAEKPSQQLFVNKLLSSSKSSTVAVTHFSTPEELLKRYGKFFSEYQKMAGKLNKMNQQDLTEDQQELLKRVNKKLDKLAKAKPQDWLAYNKKLMRINSCLIDMDKITGSKATLKDYDKELDESREALKHALVKKSIFKNPPVSTVPEKQGEVESFDQHDKKNQKVTIMSSLR